jgi:RimJ/RimL family protein N-acetyltransferase
MDYYDYFWQSEKVRLRPLRTEDWENSYRESFDSPSRQLLQLGIELPQSPEMAKEAIDKYTNCKEVNGIVIFAIESLDGETVGGISLHGRNEKNGIFSFGVIVYRPFRDKGYAEDAVRMLLRYCFRERRFQKCNSACVEGNEASVRLHEKLGFVEEGRRRRSFFLNGRYYDDILFGLTREEFEEIEKRDKAAC